MNGVTSNAAQSLARSAPVSADLYYCRLPRGSEVDPQALGKSILKKCWIKSIATCKGRGVCCAIREHQETRKILVELEGTAAAKKPSDFLHKPPLHLFRRFLDHEPERDPRHLSSIAPCGDHG